MLQEFLDAHQILAGSRVLGEFGHALTAVEFLDGRDDSLSMTTGILWPAFGFTGSPDSRRSRQAGLGRQGEFAGDPNRVVRQPATLRHSASSMERSRVAIQ
ncbi:MAG: hypothetical protein ABSD02_14125 [Steroidobacteraceae bacterium]